MRLEVYLQIPEYSVQTNPNGRTAFNPPPTGGDANDYVTTYMHSEGLAFAAATALKNPNLLSVSNRRVSERATPDVKKKEVNKFLLKRQVLIFQMCTLFKDTGDKDFVIDFIRMCKMSLIYKAVKDKKLSLFTNHLRCITNSMGTANKLQYDAWNKFFKNLMVLGEIFVMNNYDFRHICNCVYNFVDEKSGGVYNKKI